MYQIIFLFFDTFIRVKELPWIPKIINYEKGEGEQREREGFVLIRQLENLAFCKAIVTCFNEAQGKGPLTSEVRGDPDIAKQCF